MPDGCTDFILGVVQSQPGDDVLELGTSRGRMTAMLCTLGKKVTTLDHIDRGASVNLDGLDAEVITTDALQFLLKTERFFSTVIVDIHDNSEARWRVLLPGLVRVVRSGGVAIVSNAQLYEIPEWVDETGVRWALENLPSELSLEHEYAGAPGVVVLRRA
jgi:protein-L-isoaspartate O-methyltransferase